MPVGRIPKVERQRARDTQKRELVKSDGKIGGYPLPDDVLPFKPKSEWADPEVPEREEWHPQTVRWWENWRRSPQATRMLTEPDWDYLLDTALMHHVAWSSGGRNSERFAEIRQRVAAFGATPVDRLRLKIEIELPPDYGIGDEGGEADAVITDINSRRKRITGA